MAKKRYINTLFWRDNYVSNLDPSEKLLFLYLITNPDTNIIGAYQLPLRQISIDTGFEKDMVIKILDRFQTDGKILYQDGWIAIKNFAKHQNHNSPFIQTSLENEYKNLPLFIQTWYRDGLETVLNKHIYISKSKSKSKDKSKSIFVKPSPKEVQEYLNSINCKSFTGQYFCDKNDSIGWTVGRNKAPMKDWKAAVRTWINIDNTKSKKSNLDTPESRDARAAEIKRITIGE